jgi:amino acid transporter
MSYLPVFPAFLKLRKIDPDAERPYRVPGGPVLHRLMVIFPVFFLVLSIFFCCVPLSMDETELSEKIPLITGVIVAIIIGEIIAARSVKNAALASGK